MRCHLVLLSLQSSIAEATSEAVAEARRIKRQRKLDQVEIPEDHLFITTDMLGKGGFGEVYLADYNGHNAAAKVRGGVALSKRIVEITMGWSCWTTSSRTCKGWPAPPALVSRRTVGRTQSIVLPGIFCLHGSDVLRVRSLPPEHMGVIDYHSGWKTETRLTD